MVNFIKNLFRAAGHRSAANGGPCPLNSKLLPNLLTMTGPLLTSAKPLP